MENMLYSKDLYDPVEGDKSKGTKSDAEWKKLNRKAVALIRQWLDLSMIPHVDTETNSKKMWKKLKELYERKNVQNKAFLIRKLINMKYIESKSMPKHLGFQETVNQLINNEITLNDELQALLLLSSLPDSWKVLVVTLTNSAPKEKLMLAMVIESMLNEEARRRERGLTNTSSQSEALVLESRGEKSK
ncbi:uncharacterized protein LOC107611236 [Arachis ipaensis]|uniref:uncharacterized protein LOC107611236 n=1 Tax=Arachis ipaensis TaxID=130454 RepID=UPI0007AFB8E7|nr:uncharacterized protein LOC107611236 [Arachis ipaensis]XP_029150760.1 uncharacterized protein LOC114925795 [Arachis hypogaea]